MTTPEPSNFLRSLVEEHLRTGRHTGVVTRFPPEPNGYLHIGHAKSIGVNFGLAQEFGGRCHLRFDDTNPTKESDEYVRAIQEDVRWLGYDWGEHLYFASDYFPQLYAWAVWLIERGLAYVCEQTEEEMRRDRGTVTEPGVPSPWRARPPAESLDLFARMKAGEFPEGRYTVRLVGDMAAANMKMRDPAIYRILRVPHHHVGAGWNVYPLYDYAHGLSDAIEGITHSICTLEFENNREIYDWLIDRVPVPAQPRQYEFARLNLSYTVMSKRKLLRLVQEKVVEGWDDPRMPTLAGLRRRGIRPQALRDFSERIGLAKANSVVDLELLEFSIRNDLNGVAPRLMGVLHPLEVELTNWPEDETLWLEAALFPPDVANAEGGTRKLPFGRHLLIEREDFALEPPPGFKRLSPGAAVRLRHAYVVRCDEVVRDAAGEVVKLLCTVDPASRGAGFSEGFKPRGTLHWVARDHAVSCPVWKVGNLFRHESPDAAPGDLLDWVDPTSAEVVSGRVEPALFGFAPDTRFQLERLGYFWRDPSAPERLLRIVSLKSGWSQEAPKDTRPEVAPAAPVAAPAAPAALRERSPAALALVERGLSADDASTVADSPQLAAWLEDGVAAGGSARTVGALLANDVRALQKEGSTPGLDGVVLGRLAALVDAGRLTSPLARRLLARLAAEGGDPEALMRAEGWEVVQDEAALQRWVEEVLAAHPDKVAAYRGGRAGLFGFFVGGVLQRSGGRADPVRVRALLEAALAAPSSL